MSQKLEFLEGRVLIEQNEVSVLLSQKKQITITVLENGKPTSVRASAKYVYDLLSDPSTLAVNLSLDK